MVIMKLGPQYIINTKIKIFLDIILYLYSIAGIGIGDAFS